LNRLNHNAITYCFFLPYFLQDDHLYVQFVFQCPGFKQLKQSLSVLILFMRSFIFKLSNKSQALILCASLQIKHDSVECATVNSNYFVVKYCFRGYIAFIREIWISHL
jgi:hypothetical protein